MNWIKKLTKAEINHLRENVTALTGMSNKSVVVDNLKLCDCLTCKTILAKIT